MKNITSLKKKEFSLGKDPSSWGVGEEALFYWNNVLSQGKDLNSPRKHMFPIFLQSQSFHIYFYIGLQPIIEKV